jgi:hypothetical protein
MGRGQRTEAVTVGRSYQKEWIPSFWPHLHLPLLPLGNVPCSWVIPGKKGMNKSQQSPVIMTCVLDLPPVRMR